VETETAKTGLRSALRQQIPFVVVVVLFVFSALVTERALGRPQMLQLRIFSPRLLLGVAVYVPLLVMYHATRSVVVEKKSVLDPGTWKAFAERNLSLETLLPAVLLLGLVGLVSSTFISYKALIPEINPFSWDAAFLDLDSWLHGGRHPWKLLAPVFGSASMVGFLDTVYVMWFPALILTVIWQAWNGRDPLRAQFFLTYALTWIILGLFLAVALSSAGPCYYLDVTGAPSTYDELMLHLADIDRTRPLMALEIQEHLWNAYTGKADFRYEGISAMPSMHVAMAMLMVLVHWRANRLAGIVAGVFAVLILIGSVMLGWHYAIDGYVGAVLVVPVWWFSGRFLAALRRAADEG